VLGSILLQLFCQNGSAQEASRVNLFLGYSYTRVNPSSSSSLDGFSLQGGDVSISYKAYHWLTAVADFGASASGHHNSDIIGIQTHGVQETYLFGPRASLPRWRRITPFAQALVGVAHASHGLYDTTGSQTSFSWAAGGGFDYRLSGSFSLRLLQVDFLQSKFSEVGNCSQYQNNVRVSTGLVVHF
jgi:opacity protein-like surface antigen